MEDCSILGIETMESKKKVSLNFCGVVLSWACSLSAYSTDPTADPAAADPASPASQVFEAVETYQAASLGNHCPQNQLLLSSLEHVLYIIFSCFFRVGRSGSLVGWLYSGRMPKSEVVMNVLHVFSYSIVIVKSIGNHDDMS